MIPTVVFVVGPLTITLALEDFPTGVKVTVDGPVGRLSGDILAREGETLTAKDLPAIVLSAGRNYLRAADLSKAGTPDADVADKLNAEAADRAKKAREALN